jgi:CrcB protein
MVASFGALGATCRYLIGLSVLKYAPSSPFVGTLIANLVGCFLFGVVSQLGAGAALSPQMRLALLTGFLGAFTTFSAFSFDTITLAETRGFTWAAGYVLAQNVLGIALAWVGISLAR